MPLRIFPLHHHQPSPICLHPPTQTHTDELPADLNGTMTLQRAQLIKGLGHHLRAALYSVRGARSQYTHATTHQNVEVRLVLLASVGLVCDLRGIAVE